MFRKVLIANRGAIACRIIRTLRRLGHRLASRSIPRPTAIRCTVLAGRRSRAARPRAGRGKLSRRSRPSSRRARQTGAEAIHPGYGFLSREPGFAERLRGGGHHLHRPDAGADARLRPQAHGARARRSARRAAAAGQRSARRRRRSAKSEAAAHRLSGDAEEHGGRRRHRHAARAIGRRRSLPHASSACERLARNNFRRRRRLPREISSHARATSRCRSSATARATSSRSASATARCSGATRRSSRRRRRRVCPTRTRAALHDAATAARRSGELRIAPARSSSSTTPTATSSTSSRSTRGCRSSMASPRRSPASIWSNG